MEDQVGAIGGGGCPANCAPAAWQTWVTDTDNNPTNDLFYFPNYDQYYRPQPWLLDIDLAHFTPMEIRPQRPPRRA